MGHFWATFGPQGNFCNSWIMIIMVVWSRTNIYIYIIIIIVIIIMIIVILYTPLEIDRVFSSVLKGLPIRWFQVLCTHLSTRSLQFSKANLKRFHWLDLCLFCSALQLWQGSRVNPWCQVAHFQREVVRLQLKKVLLQKSLRDEHDKAAPEHVLLFQQESSHGNS